MLRFHFLLLVLLIFSPVINQAKERKTLYDVLGVSEISTDQEIQRAFQQWSNQSYYEILGLSKKATPKEVKKAYLRLQLIIHPDRNLNNVKSKQLAHKLSATLNQKHNNKDRQNTFRYETSNTSSQGNHDPQRKSNFNNNSSKVASMLDKMLLSQAIRENDMATVKTIRGLI